MQRVQPWKAELPTFFKQTESIYDRFPFLQTLASMFQWLASWVVHRVCTHGTLPFYSLLGFSRLNKNDLTKVTK